MRLLYRWFCRIIGVGSALDIMNLYVVMLIWIFGALITFFPEDVNGKKHRSAHRQGHHRHHHHRHHKHPKLHHHLPINGNFTVKPKGNSHLSPKNLNVTKIVNTKPWILPETSTTLFVNSSFADKEEIESLNRKMSTEKISFLSNSVQTPNGLKNPSSFNNYTELSNNSDSSPLNSNSNYDNTSHTDFRNIFVASRVKMRIIEESTTQFFAQTFPSSSRLREAEEIIKDATTDSSNNSFNMTEVEREKIAEDLHNLFGSPKDQKYSTDSVIDNNPVVELIRKKRSPVTVEEDKSVDAKIRKETLENFSGPKILDDPEEIEDLESADAVHKRVKRDGSELDDDDDRSALSSLDSTYLRNLEDSFPLSALEVQAQRSEGLERSKNIARNKRAVEFDTEEETTKNGSFGLEENNRINDVEKSTNDSSPLNLNEEQKTIYFQAGSQKTPAQVFQTEANSILRNRVNIQHPAKIPSIILSDNEVISNDSAIGSRTSTPTESTSEYIDPVLKNRVNDIVSHEDISIADENNAQSIRDDDVNGEQSSIKDVEHPQISSSDRTIVKDDDSISRYRLDDVYPEIMQDSENPSSMVQLVRTKRFGDSIVYPEAPDAAYANEIDNSRTADEPYAEDNRIIDSMLSKVEYRNVDEEDAGSDNESPFGKDEIDADKQNYNKREEVAIRGKRGKSSKRTRKKKVHNRRKHGKRKKNHKQRGKKHKSKRWGKNGGSRNLSKREFDIDNSLSDVSRVDGESLLNENEENVILARERRRRESEDEDEENNNSQSIETAARVRRDTRKIPEANSDVNISPNTVINMESKIRDKRKSVAQNLHNFENVREANVGQNRSEEMIEVQKADVLIQDIRKHVVELLTKVDDLLGYATENSGDNQQNNVSKRFYMLNNNTDKVLQQNTQSQSAGNTPLNAAHAITRSEACWKHPTSWNSEFKARKNSRPVRNLRNQRCGKNVRRKRKSHHKWDRWTDWSSCSVTCGRGRQIRWRHCVRNCSNAETEMEEKACQLPACAPGKFLGIFG